MSSPYGFFFLKAQIVPTVNKGNHYAESDSKDRMHNPKRERNPELILEQLCKTTLNSKNQIIFVPLSVNLFLKNNQSFGFLTKQWC